LPLAYSKVLLIAGPAVADTMPRPLDFIEIAPPPLAMVAGFGLTGIEGYPLRTIAPAIVVVVCGGRPPVVMSGPAPGEAFSIVLGVMTRVARGGMIGVAGSLLVLWRTGRMRILRVTVWVTLGVITVVSSPHAPNLRRPNAVRGGGL
jgi:hypothetical protein